MKMSKFSLYQNEDTNRSSWLHRERPTSMNDYYNYMERESAYANQNRDINRSPWLHREQPTEINGYYNHMEPESAYAHVKREFKVEDDNYLSLQTWIPNEIEETDHHCFVPRRECKYDPNDIKTIYECCNIKFFDKFLHFSHMIDHMEMQLMRSKCYYCNFIFNTEDDRIRHERCAYIGFKCAHCTQKFVKKTFLFKHLANFHGYFYPNKKENVFHPKRCQFGRTYKKGKEIYPPKYKRGLSDNMKPKCKVKMEPISNDETEITNVKMEPTHITMTLTDAVVKMEPTDSNISHNEMELTLSKIKREPID